MLEALRRSQTGFALIVSAVAGLSGIVISIIVVRSLGVRGRGELTAALLWPLLLLYVCNTGLIPSVLFAVSRERADPAILRTALRISVVQGAVGCGLGYVILPYLLQAQSEQTVHAARIGLLLILVGLPFAYALAALQGRLLLQQYNVLRVATPLLSLLVIPLLAAWDELTIQLAVGVPIMCNAAALVPALMISYRAKLLDGPPSMLVSRQLFHYARRAQLGELAILVNIRLDQVLLAASAAPELLGSYVIALSLSTGLYALSGSLRSIAQPRIANRVTPQDRRREVEVQLRRYGLVAGPATILCMVGSPVLLPVLFGSAGRADGVLAAAEVLLLAALVYGLKETAAAALQALGEPWRVSQADLLASVVTIIGLVVVVGRASLPGIASVSLLAYSVQAILCLRALRRVVPFAWPSVYRWRTT